MCQNVTHEKKKKSFDSNNNNNNKRHTTLSLSLNRKLACQSSVSPFRPHDGITLFWERFPPPPL